MIKDLQNMLNVIGTKAPFKKTRYSNLFEQQSNANIEYKITKKQKKQESINNNDQRAPEELLNMVEIMNDCKLKEKSANE